MNLLISLFHLSDPPSKVTLDYFPSNLSEVVKGANITLNCTVLNPGRPDNLTYYWYRGNHRMEEYSSRYVSLKSLRVEERSKFTCMAVNDGGESERASVDIKVNGKEQLLSLYLVSSAIIFFHRRCFLYYLELEVIYTNNNITSLELKY